MYETLVEETGIKQEKTELEELLKPFQQEQNRRQKKIEFFKKCVQSLDKNDFFSLDSLLQTKLTEEILEEVEFAGCTSIFSRLRSYANQQIEQYQLQFQRDFLQLAAMEQLPVKMDGFHFTVLNGIEGAVDFIQRKTTINQQTIKSVDPRRVIAAILSIKRKLYDSPFDPQKFIDTLFGCYQAIRKRAPQESSDVVSVWDLYTEYVWAIQNKTFFQNMDKSKFKGYSVEQFVVDLWRFFQSNHSSAPGSYCLKLHPGKSKALSLIAQDGERRFIAHISFSNL